MNTEILKPEIVPGSRVRLIGQVESATVEKIISRRSPGVVKLAGKGLNGLPLAHLKDLENIPMSSLSELI